MQKIKGVLFVVVDALELVVVDEMVSLGVFLFLIVRWSSR